MALEGFGAWDGFGRVSAVSAAGLHFLGSCKKSRQLLAGSHPA